MARKTKEVLHGEVFERARKQFSAIMGAQRAERELCLSDRRFYSIAGAQWEGALSEQFENRPQFEFNKIHLAVIRIINEYRNNRMSVVFVPKDGAQEKSNDDITGIYRADMNMSCGEEAKDNAFEEAVGGGFGAYRLRNVEEDEFDSANEKQKIIAEPIYDADSCVFFDLSTKRQDKSDANHAYVLRGVPYDEYIAEYNDNPASWPKDVSMVEFDWLIGKDTVYIAEYYEKEFTKETLRVFRGVDGTERTYSDDELDDELDEILEVTGFREVRQRKIKKCRVHKYILSGGGIIEDCGYIAGRDIPIVPVYGKRWMVDGVERCMGHVRLAKDAQRLKNLQLSKLGEISALSSVEKPILTPEQVSGHEVMWAEDNVRQYPYLLINPITDANGNSTAVPPTGYTRPPAVPPALAALLQTTEQDIRDILGNPERAEIVSPNASGVAIELAQSKVDMQTFIYLSNFAKAEKRCAEIWLGMAKEVYVEESRKLRTVNDAGELGSVAINSPMLSPETGAVEYNNDLSSQSFDVVVDVVPSSVSRRAATVRALTQMIGMTQDPETQQVLSATAMMNMDAEGISDIRKYFRNKLLQIGAVEPTKEEAAQLAAAQQAQSARPDVQAEFFMAEAEKAQANAAKARAETVLTMAKVDQTRADTVSTMADIEKTKQETRSSIQKDYAETLDRLKENGNDLLVTAEPQVSEQKPAPAQPESLGELGVIQ